MYGIHTTLSTGLLSIVQADDSNEKAKHVIIISCDGLRPDAVEFLGPKWAPNFHRLINRGSYSQRPNRF